MPTSPSGTVLLLEDDDGIRDLLSLVLDDDGHDVRPCESADEIVDVAAASPGAVAVADFWGESHEALSDDERAEIVQLARTVPTILVTGRVWATPNVAGELGLVALVQKPFDVDDLCATVTKALGDGMGAATA